MAVCTAPSSQQHAQPRERRRIWFSSGPTSKALRLKFRETGAALFFCFAELKGRSRLEVGPMGVRAETPRLRRPGRVPTCGPEVLAGGAGDGLHQHHDHPAPSGKGLPSSRVE